MNHALAHASSATRQGTSGSIEQYQLAEILLGAQHYDLKGFFSSEKEPCGMSEALPGISASVIASPEKIACQINQEALERKRNGFFWLAFAAIFTVSAIAVAGFFIGRLTDSKKPSDALAWRVVEVKADGVLVAVGAGSEQTLHIPKGARLPDGQRLLAVNQERQVYSTDRQDVRVRRALNEP